MICQMCMAEMREVHEVGSSKLIAYYCMKCGAKKEVEWVGGRKNEI